MATAEAPDLTEDQIDALLREAEERLAAKSTPAVLVASAKGALQLADPDAAKAVAAPVAATGLVSAKPANVAVRTVLPGKTKQQKTSPKDAGPDWFGIPKTVVTPEVKRDFQVLRMRGVLDTKHHFRKDNRKNLIPQYSAFGTIVEGIMSGKHDRLTRKERRRTIAEEVLASQTTSTSFKKRYGKIQEKKTSGRKGFYKQLVAGRRKRP